MSNYKLYKQEGKLKPLWEYHSPEEFAVNTFIIDPADWKDYSEGQVLGENEFVLQWQRYSSELKKWLVWVKEDDKRYRYRQVAIPAKPSAKEKPQEEGDVHETIKIWRGIWNEAYKMNQIDFQREMRKKYSLSSK